MAAARPWTHPPAAASTAPGGPPAATAGRPRGAAAAAAARAVPVHCSPGGAPSRRAWAEASPPLPLAAAARSATAAGGGACARRASAVLLWFAVFFFSSRVSAAGGPRVGGGNARRRTRAVAATIRNRQAFTVRPRGATATPRDAPDRVGPPVACYRPFESFHQETCRSYSPVRRPPKIPHRDCRRLLLRPFLQQTRRPTPARPVLPVALFATVSTRTRAHPPRHTQSPPRP